MKESKVSGMATPPHPVMSRLPESAPTTPLSWLTQQAFAHRGRPNARAPMNSLAAFDGAIERGEGVVLEAQLSYDGDAIVYGEADLSIMTRQHGPVLSHGSITLRGTALLNTEETIPSVATALQHVAGRAPVLICVLPTGDGWLPLCYAIRRALEGYRGAVGVFSRDPRIAAWFAKHAPRVTRGLSMSPAARGDHGLWGRGLLAQLGLADRLDMARAEPDFLVVPLEDLPTRSAATMRQRGVTIFASGVESDEARERAAHHADNVILETARHAARNRNWRDEPWHGGAADRSARPPIETPGAAVLDNSRVEPRLT